MKFAADDPFVACSKPACFCCLLYFWHHPGHFVEPDSHNKIYLNWRPPGFRILTGVMGPTHQRDILNGMNKDIRREALRQIYEKTAPQAWHPDSLTGITQSAQHEQDDGAREESNAWSCTPSEVSTWKDLVGPLYSWEATPPLFWAMSMKRAEAEPQDETSSLHDTEDTSQYLEQLLEDSDDAGGVLL
jgi:hypothetical protein